MKSLSLNGIEMPTLGCDLGFSRAEVDVPGAIDVSDAHVDLAAGGGRNSLP